MKAVLVVATMAAVQVAAFDWVLSGAGNQFTSFTTTLTVPPLPQRPATGDATYFLWPGLQTTSAIAASNPFGFGVLQPVLSYGPSCTPKATGIKVYDAWYIACQYVNPNNAKFFNSTSGCLAGNMMQVQPGTQLSLSLVLQGTKWLQTATSNAPCWGVGTGVDTAQGCQVTYLIDLKGELQPRAEILPELYYQAVIRDPVVFSNIVLTTQTLEPNATIFCKENRGLQPSSTENSFTTESCTGYTLSSDKKTCTIDNCTFQPAPNPVVPPPSSAGGGTDGNGNPISPGQVVPPPPPPADATSDPSATETASDPSATSTSSGGSQLTTNPGASSSSSKTGIYAGVACGVAIVAAVAGFVYKRSISNKSGVALDDAFEMNKEMGRGDNDLPPLPPPSAAKLQDYHKSEYVHPVAAANVATDGLEKGGSGNGRSQTAASSSDSDDEETVVAGGSHRSRAGTPSTNSFRGAVASGNGSRGAHGLVSGVTVAGLGSNNSRRPHTSSSNGHLASSIHEEGVTRRPHTSSSNGHLGSSMVSSTLAGAAAVVGQEESSVSRRSRATESHTASQASRRPRTEASREREVVSTTSRDSENGVRGRSVIAETNASGNGRQRSVSRG